MFFIFYTKWFLKKTNFLVQNIFYEQIKQKEKIGEKSNKEKGLLI